MSSHLVVDVDEAARRFAVDPANNVVLEASAGTGKTTVLVQRYINLLRAGVEPANILAITFTRKAATEMRERIVRDLRAAASISEFDRARWVALRDRLGEISISTIDAFCLSLLREFPLEADLDPGFDLADETEVPRFVEESLDRSMRIFARLAESDEDIALVLAQLGSSRTRAGLGSLLDRRIVAWDALNRFLAHGPADLTAINVCRRAAAALRSALDSVPGGLPRMLAEGPSGHPRYQLLLREMARLEEFESARPSEIRAVLDRVSLHFLTQDGTARKGGSISPYNASHWMTADAARRHRESVFAIAPRVEQVMRQFARDFNVVLARGIRRMFAVSLEQYQRTLAARAVLDFSDVLQRALELLRRMDEFSQSRYRLESRYHHVLVDEFQDTSRAQWELVSLLVQSWGEGLGLASNPSIFIVGDRKQSIYRFRDAEVAVLQEAGRYIDALRPDGGARQAIARSFRAIPELLEFVNELCTDMSLPAARPDAFAYRDIDRFPAIGSRDAARGPALGVAVGDDPAACAAAVADEIARILREDEVRDRRTGVSRPATAGDIAILFRSRTSHREFEQELAARNVPTYVYKGLGFFDSDEIKDATALLRFLAQPQSDLRAAAFLRSRFVRLSDSALAALAPRLAVAITGPAPDVSGLDDEDRRVLEFVRAAVPGWLELVDRVAPADLFERILPDAAYAFELRGRRRQQAWENLKKMRGLIRRVQNRGYATLARIADHIDSLSAGDESNAVLEAIDAVNLMTVHASKGLEFPIVFVVNMARGAGGLPRPVRVIADGDAGVPSVSVSPFMSETDELEREREQHETRRLVYVALTRARDRLYLSSSLKDGALQAGRGGLADVLPPSMRAVFEGAAVATAETVTWTSNAGREFKWRVCRPAASARVELVPQRPADPIALLDPTAPSRETVRLSASEWLRRQYPEDEERGDGGSPRDLLIGSLVHRLFQNPPSPDADVIEYARTRVRADEQSSSEDLDASIASGVAIWEEMRNRPEVAAVLGGACVLAEVPFSLRLDESGGAVIRGTIDCLAIGADGSVTVLEYKTGGPRPVHQAQLDLYLRAARSLFPGARVEGRLVYHRADHNSVLRQPTMFDWW
jgi:ATP-dependent helicase/nuclease subunit A